MIYITIPSSTSSYSPGILDIVEPPGILTSSPPIVTFISLSYRFPASPCSIPPPELPFSVISTSYPSTSTVVGKLVIGFSSNVFHSCVIPSKFFFIF